MIAFTEVSLGSGGTVSCSRCGVPELRVFAPAEEVVAVVRMAVSGWRAGPGPNVSLVGVEPFAHPALPAIVAGAVELGVERIRLRTDGGALASSENAVGALHAGVRHLELLLLGGRAAHDELSGRPGLFDAADAGARAFRDAALERGAPVAITGLVPVCRHTIEHAGEAVAALAMMGAVAVTLHVAADAASAVGARQWLSGALETGTTGRVWVHVRGLAADDVPVSPLHATPVAVVEGACR